MTASTEQERALADLRHMYAQMVGGMVKDSAQAKRIADGILSRAIHKLEQAARRAQAVPVPQSIEQMAVDRYKVVPSHSSMFYPCAVVAGDGQQQIYIGREAECQNMARKFTGAFLDGAFVALAAAPQPPEAAQLDDTNVVDMAQAVDSKEAAPVQMPEPVYTMRVRGMLHDYTPGLQAFDLDDGEHKLYTEHQVLAILAQHGIKTK